MAHINGKTPETKIASKLAGQFGRMAIMQHKARGCGTLADSVEAAVHPHPEFEGGWLATYVFTYEGVEGPETCWAQVAFSVFDAECREHKYAEVLEDRVIEAINWAAEEDERKWLAEADAELDAMPEEEKERRWAVLLGDSGAVINCA